MIAVVFSGAGGTLSPWRSLPGQDTRMIPDFRRAEPGADSGAPLRTVDGADTWRYLD